MPAWDGVFEPTGQPASGEDRAGRSTWWRFWEMGAWREWWSRRRPWTEHRREVRSLRSRIGAEERGLRGDHAAHDQAERDLGWAAEVSPREVPVRTARAENGLASVANVTLLELRKKEGREAWAPVDTGTVHFTDRKMVFSGRKSVEFRFDKTTVAELRAEGLFVAVSSRRRDHVLSGPKEQLQAVLTACQAVAAGQPPVEPFTSRIEGLNRSVASGQASLDRQRQARAALIAPPRPISPAWLPGVFLLVVAGLLSSPSAEPGLAAVAETTTSTTAVSTTTTSTLSTGTTVSPEPTPPPVPVASTAPDAASTTVTTADVAPPAPATDIPGEMAAYFFDVGQGDSTLLVGPDFNILVDAGRHDRSEVVDHLRHVGVQQLDVLVGTHPHADHIGQFPAVIDAFPVEDVWMSGASHTTQTFERALDAVERSDAGYHEPRAGEVFDVGSARIEVLNPTTVSGALNGGSLVMRIVLGEMAFLFTGDAEAPAERDMIGRDVGLGAQVLKVGHHGSSTSSTQEFLEAVAPTVAIYSAGEGNQYGHPHDEVLARLFALEVDIYGTDVHGTVMVTTDGQTYTVSTERSAAISEPSLTTTTTRQASEGSGACSPGQVDVNSASFEELHEIIHIGPDRAQQILDLRPLASVDSMDRVSGIAEARLADIKAQGVACAG